MTMHIPPPHPMETDEMVLLFEQCANKLWESSNPDSFLAWIEKAGPLLAPGMAAAIDPRTGPVGRAFRVLGTAIYNAMPLPDRNFRRVTLPKPGRNDPCICGSGRKFKQCCQGMGEILDLTGYNMLRHMLDILPKKNFQALPASAVDSDMVADTARQWYDEARPELAVALLEPWFKIKGTLSHRLDMLFDLLMDCYLQLGNSRKRERLLADCIARGDKGMKASALQRRATIQADQGDMDSAWADFKAAQQLYPDDPALSGLELTLLMSRGQVTQARERARFWLARLKRDRDADPGLLEFLRQVAENPDQAFSGIARQNMPALDQLARLLVQAPPPARHHKLKSLPDGYSLQPDKALIKIEKIWQRVFMGEDEDFSPWDQPAGWLALLENEPLAWQSFTVLCALVISVEELRMPGSDSAFIEPLLSRSRVLLEQVWHDAKPGEKATLPWYCMENRAALFMLSQLTMSRYEQQRLDQFIPLAEWMLRLNPNDNHGIRMPLSTAYLRKDAFDKVLGLRDSYENDHTHMCLNYLLAYYRAGQRKEALQILLDNAKYLATAVDMLLAENPKPPKISGYGVTAGGKDEAWLYREEHLAQWMQDDARQWLAQAWGAVRKGSKKR